MNNQIYQEASEWFISFRAGDVDATDRKRFDVWIRKSPEHLRAYLEITEVWQDAAFVQENASTSASALVESARTDDPNVIALERAEPAAALPPQPTGPFDARGQTALNRRAAKRKWVAPNDGFTPEPDTTLRLESRKPRFVRYGAAAACLLLAVVVGGGFYLNAQRHTYVTGIGEQRLINLEDGSTVRLNARSTIRIHFSSEQRGVELIEGQAFFDVARDARRPFLVRSDTTQARAVGTQFDVYRRATGTTVTVVEGRVAVAPAHPLISKASAEASGTNDHVSPAPGEATSPLPGEIVLAAGEQVTVTEKSASPVQKASAASVTAWTQHQLVFKSSSLAEVVEQFNRYNTRQLVIEGAGLADFHISGVYSSTDPGLLLRFLREQPNVRVQESETEIRISRTP